MLISKPPVIRNTGRHGTFIEGDHDAPPAQRDLLERGLASFGHLVHPHTTLTGGQWLHAIWPVADTSSPATTAILAAIRGVMRTDEFLDDLLLSNPDGVPTFRGTVTQCLAHLHRFIPKPLHDRCLMRPVAQASPGDCDAAQVAEVRASLGIDGRLQRVEAGEETPSGAVPAGLWGLPREYYVLPSPLPGAKVASELSMLGRKLGLLDASPVGAETFTQAQGEDRQAVLALMVDLVGHLGYDTVIASVPTGRTVRPRPGALVEDRRNVELKSADLERSMADLCDTLAAAGIEQGANESPGLFLCRPAPLINPLASIRPFESVVHSRLIGWRLPRAQVQLEMEKAVGRLRQAEAGRSAQRQRGG